MKKILVIVMLIFAFGCSDDGTNPEPNVIVGKWSKGLPPDGIFGESILILEFTNDGKFIKTRKSETTEETSGGGTYTIAGDVITFIGGDCVTLNGKYKFEFKDNGAEFTLIEDECKAREYLIDFFDKYIE